MNNLDIKSTRETFARLFVLAVQNKMNLYAFTNALIHSEFIKLIEEDRYTDYFNKSLKDIFFDITNFTVIEDNSFAIYDDAYWSGYMYFELHQKIHKPFAFIFLKLPLVKMMELYPVYHEMDYSALYEQFDRFDKKKTIMNHLLENNRCSINKLSKSTDIALSTLRKYASSDKALYNASFKNINQISSFFEAPMSLFVE